ncbi:hypothetical protein ABIE69_001387 [Rhodobacteraceae bacterium MBR-64]|jgi:hypothetical protein
MDHLPLPPGSAALRAIASAIHTLAKGRELARIWFADSRHPTGFARMRHFGPTASRFDHHLAGPGGAPVNGARAILYAIEVPDTPPKTDHAFVAALAEVFQQTRTIDLGREAPRLTLWRAADDLPLLDLTEYWTTKVGASAALSSGPRDITRAWSRDFHEAYPQIAGLRYRSAMSGGQAIALALYERASATLPAAPVLDLPLDHPALRAALVRGAQRLGYTILPA